MYSFLMNSHENWLADKLQAMIDAGRKSNIMSPAASGIVLIKQETLIQYLDQAEYDLIPAVNMIEKSISPSSMEYLLSFVECLTYPGQLHAFVDKTPWITFFRLAHFEIVPYPFADDLSECTFIGSGYRLCLDGCDSDFSI
ncbi:hypothetical protein G9A89_000193 [Geosiphon pyriformis]|nr:hypothetical protein G9A89_000193 [Geosiphon pyriformis]